MGLFGRLFGKSDRRDATVARCNECGMTGDRHTDWCPAAAEAPRDAAAGRPATDGATHGAGGAAGAAGR